MTGTVGIVGGTDRTLDELIRAIGMRSMVIDLAAGSASRRGPSSAPAAVLVDIRGQRELLGAIGGIKRRYPGVGIAIIVDALDPELMLEAMRSGVTEALPEPLTQTTLEAAINRVAAHHTKLAEGKVFALVGAKGGIGATTVAVNLAEALTASLGSTLLIDLQAAAGDASILLGVDPRFTVADALENTHRLDETFFKGLVVRTKSGLDLLAASTRVVNAPIDPHRIHALIEFATRYYRAVILDVPRGDLALIDSLDTASAVFIVVNHELPTIRAAHRLMVKLRQRFGDRIALLVNRWDKQADITLDDISNAVGAPIKHVFPSDYRAALAAVNKGQALALLKDSRLAQSFHECAAALTDERAKARTKGRATAAEESGGLFGWLSPRRSTS